MGRKHLFAVGVLLGVIFLSQPLGAADKQQELDEKLLRQAGLGTDWDSLLAFLRRPPEIAADAERIQRLVRQLGSEDFQEREQASKELMACGRAALEPLRKALQSGDPEAVRRAKACIEDIETGTNPQLCAAAIRLLARLRPTEAVPVLLEALGHPDKTARDWAYSQLRQLVGPKDIPDVLKATKDKRPNVRAGAVGLSHLFKDQPKVFTPTLLEALRDESELVRRRAAGVLWGFGSEEGVVPALITALEDKDVAPDSVASVSQAAAATLGGLGARARPAVPALMQMSKVGNERYRYSATLALGHLGSRDKEVIPTIVPFLMEVFEDKKQPIGNRATAVTALGLLGPDAKAGVAALREALRGEDAGDPKLGNRIHNCVISALGRIGPGAEAAVPDLAAFLRDRTRNRRDRELAAEALGAIGPSAKPAIPALIQALKDDYPCIRQAAARSLRAVGPPPESALPALIDALKDEHTQVSVAAAEILGTIGPAARSAVPALTEALKHLSPEIRQAAAHALKKIEEKPE